MRRHVAFSGIISLAFVCLHNGMAEDVVAAPPNGAPSEKELLKRKHVQARRDVETMTYKLQQAESQLRACENNHRLLTESGKTDIQAVQRLAGAREQLWDLQFSILQTRADEEKAAIAALVDDPKKAQLLSKDSDAALQEEIQKVSDKLTGEVGAALNEAENEQRTRIAKHQNCQTERTRLSDELSRQQQTCASTEASIAKSRSDVQSLVDSLERQRGELNQTKKELDRVATEERLSKQMAEAMGPVISQLKVRKESIRKRTEAARVKAGAGQRGASEPNHQELTDARRQFADLRAKAEEEAKAQLEADRKQRIETARNNDVANATTYVLKDGRKLIAAKVIDAGDTLAIKTPEGKMTTIKKSEIVEKIEPKPAD